MKSKRETASYSVTKKTTKEIAEHAKADARQFVDRIEEIFDFSSPMPDSQKKRGGARVH